jgi:hypothetical protein
VRSHTQQGGLSNGHLLSQLSRSMAPRRPITARLLAPAPFDVVEERSLTGSLLHAKVLALV